MTAWTPFPHPEDFCLTTERVVALWDALHAGDALPCPTDAAVLQAWVLFHRGDFAQAYAEGLRLGDAGATVAHKAGAIYANYLEPSEEARMALLWSIVERAEDHTQRAPQDANAWYGYAYALGRYCQSVSVAKVLGQGLGRKVRKALETTIALSPQHADAHVALGAFHAEVIDKVGPLIGMMTYAVKKEDGLAWFERALALNPRSIIAKMEYAHALVMLNGEAGQAQANTWYEAAATSAPLDAREWLDVDMARTELAAS